jgi:hypothetical protein
MTADMPHEAYRKDNGIQNKVNQSGSNESKLERSVRPKQIQEGEGLNLFDGLRYMVKSLYEIVYNTGEAYLVKPLTHSYDAVGKGKKDRKYGANNPTPATSGNA